MAAEVVGTAFVRIRAITANLAKDIQNGIDKGIADAKVDKAGDALGGDLGSATVDGFKDETDKGLPKALDKAAKDAGDDRRGGFAKAGRRLGAAFSKFFSSGVSDKKNDPLRKFFDGLGDKINGLSKFALPGKAWLVLLAIPALGGAIKLAGSYLAGLIGQLGYLTSAAAGAGAALAGAFVALVPAAGLLFFALKADTEAMEAFKKEAKEFLKPWSDVAAVTQEAMIPGLLASVKNLSKLAPMFADFGKTIGASAGNMLTWASAALTSKENQGALAALLTESEKAFDVLGRIVTRIADVLPKVLAPLARIGNELLLIFDGWAQKLQTFMNSAEGQDRFSAALDRWWERAKTVGEAIGDISAILWEVISIATDVFAPSMNDMADVTQRWRDNLNTDAIRRVFENALPVVREVNGLIGDMFTALGQGIAGDTSNVVAFVQQLREWLPGVLEIARQLAANLGPGLQEFGTAFGDFLLAFSESDAAGVALAVFTDTLKILADLLTNDLTGPVIGNLLVLAIGIGSVAKVAKILQLATLGKGFAMLARIAWPLIAGGITAIAAALGLPVWAVAAGIIAAVVGIFLAVKNWGKIKEFVGRAWDALVGFFRRLPGMALNAGKALLSWITDAISGVPGALLQFATAIGRWLLGLPGRILTWIGGAASALVQWIVDAAPKALLALINLWADLQIFIISIPFRILEALINAGIALYGWITESVGPALSAFAAWTGELLGKIATFITSLPGKMVGAIAGLVSWITDSGPQMAAKWLLWVADIGSKITTFVTGLPGRMVGAIAGLVGWLVDAVPGTLLNFAIWAANLGVAIWNFITGLPGRLVGAIASLVNIGSDIVAKIKKGISDAWEGLTGWLTSKVNSLWNNTLGRIPGIGDNPFGKSIPGGAEGAAPSALRVFPTPVGPTAPTVGAFSGRSVSGSGGLVSPNVTMTRGDTTMVKIENATFNQPTDLDMLVAKVRFGMRTAAA